MKSGRNSAREKVARSPYLTPEIRRIVKVGGSLLTEPELGVRLQRWTDDQSTAQECWVAGGGAEVDIIREIDSRHQLDAEISYQMTLDMLDRTCQVLQQSLRGTHGALELIEDLTSWKKSPVVAGRFIVNWHQATSCFPDPWHSMYRLATWEATSDSMAALLARWLNATELVILKACPIPEHQSQQNSMLAACGIVDSVFPEACIEIESVRVMQLP